MVSEKKLFTFLMRILEVPPLVSERAAVKALLSLDIVADSTEFTLPDNRRSLHFALCPVFQWALWQASELEKRIKGVTASKV